MVDLILPLAEQCICQLLDLLTFFPLYGLLYTSTVLLLQVFCSNRCLIGIRQSILRVTARRIVLQYSVQHTDTTGLSSIKAKFILVAMITRRNLQLYLSRPVFICYSVIKKKKLFEFKPMKKMHKDERDQKSITVSRFS